MQTSTNKWALAGLLLLTTVFFPTFVRAQTGQIAGVAVDSLSGTPIPGLNIVIVGTTTGASTAGDGSYAIAGLEPGSYDLMASFVGYVTRLYQGIQVSAGQTTDLDLYMVSDLLQLDEIFATAYGTVERQAVTGSVADVDLEYLESRPLSSVDQAIEGADSGCHRSKSIGDPGRWTGHPGAWYGQRRSGRAATVRDRWIRAHTAH